MEYLIGTDEAGYGPNLGPLVVSATVWQVPTGVRSEDLYRRLAGVIVPTPEAANKKTAACLAIGDSKILYKAGNGLRHLERGLWAALALLDQQPDIWSDVWDAMAPESAEALQAIPWYADYDAPVPVDADLDELAPLFPALAEGLGAAGVRLVEIYSRAIFPGQFNELLDQHESKGAVLSHLTLELVAHMMKPLDDGTVSIVCDKHGGRNRYMPLLSHHFPDSLVEVHGESRQRSTYRFGPQENRAEICFQTKAESHLSAALASMASKYLRELAMQALNDFWCERVDDLEPTAGYPQDAKRFKKAIAKVQAELEIEDHILWRTK